MHGHDHPRIGDDAAGDREVVTDGPLEDLAGGFPGVGVGDDQETATVHELSEDRGRAFKRPVFHIDNLRRHHMGLTAIAVEALSEQPIFENQVDVFHRRLSVYRKDWALGIGR